MSGFHKHYRHSGDCKKPTTSTQLFLNDACEAIKKSSLFLPCLCDVYVVFTVWKLPLHTSEELKESSSVSGTMTSAPQPSHWYACRHSHRLALLWKLQEGKCIQGLKRHHQAQINTEEYLQNKPQSGLSGLKTMLTHERAAPDQLGPSRFVQMHCRG